MYAVDVTMASEVEVEVDAIMEAEVVVMEL